MAKKETDWAQIIKYGKWLERLIGKKKIENWDIKPQFENALELLEIEYQFKIDHPFFIMLDQLTKEKINWTDVILKGYEDKDGPTLPATRTFQSLLNIFSIVHYLFQELLEDGRPWNVSFYEIKNKLVPYEKNESLYRNVVEKLIDGGLEKIVSEETFGVIDPRIIRRLGSTILGAYKIEKLYSRVGERILVSPNGCKKVRVLLTNKNREENEKQPFTNNDNQYLPFDTIVSRIFFEFLILGGQDYYGYCEYCKSFYIAERKGRKKFCSDVCRTLNQRK